jgi:hypothetical protein
VAVGVGLADGAGVGDGEAWGVGVGEGDELTTFITAALDRMPRLVAVTSDRPGLTALATPFALTVNTDGLLEAQPKITSVTSRLF